MNLFFEIVKLIVELLIIILVSKNLLVPIIRKLGEKLKLKPHTIGNIAGIATSIPEFLTVTFSAVNGMLDTGIFNILSSNISNTIQYTISILLNKNVNLLKTKDYNIFSVLQIQSKEVLICRMIADLLNPRGQHGAGAEYLKIFLRDCLGMEKMDTKLADQAIVTAEYAIDDERRIDIVIEIGSYFLPIEVKIYAADQKSQCFDYYQYAKRRDAQAKVYYLTLDGHRPGKDSTSSGSQSVPEEDIVCLSFREHILNWLKACKSCENTGMVPI